MECSEKRVPPYTDTWHPGVVDSFCDLQHVFKLSNHKSSFAEFRLTHRSTFPYCYDGCIANFSDPAGVLQYKWQKLLQEDCIWGSFGWPPSKAVQYTDAVDQLLVHALGCDSVIAIGKIGIDCSKDWRDALMDQKRIFRRQLTLARQRSLPVILHSRLATHETVRLIRERVGPDHPIHLQGFTASWPEAKFWLDSFPRLCLGLTPALGFPGNEALIEAARNVPLERVVFETSAPDLLPAQEEARLPCSHPGMVVHVAHQLARIREEPVEEIVAVVRENTRRVYGI
ncbi:3'-5' RNA nuclease TATDN2-like [Amblyomma americanum]